MRARAAEWATEQRFRKAGKKGVLIGVHVRYTDNLHDEQKEKFRWSFSRQGVSGYTTQCRITGVPLHNGLGFGGGVWGIGFGFKISYGSRLTDNGSFLSGTTPEPCLEPDPSRDRGGATTECILLRRADRV